MPAEIAALRDLAARVTLSRCACGEEWPHPSDRSDRPVCLACRRQVEHQRDEAREEVKRLTKACDDLYGRNQRLESKVRAQRGLIRRHSPTEPSKP